MPLPVKSLPFDWRAVPIDYNALMSKPKPKVRYINNNYYPNEQTPILRNSGPGVIVYDYTKNEPKKYEEDICCTII